MLGTLLESGPRPARRFWESVLSIAVHATVIGLAVMATVREATPRPPEPMAEIGGYAALQDQDERTTGARRGKVGTSPTTLPDPAPGPAIDGLALPSLDDVTGSPIPSLEGELSAPFPSQGGETELAAGDDALALAEVERAVVALATNRPPDYPPELRLAGIEGTVRARFVVDTLGSVERGSLTILASDHARFTDAVRRAAAEMRFRPAEARGRKVRMLVEMPFVFRLVR
jgi:TonB family protein